MSKMTFTLVLCLLLCMPRAGLSADRAELIRQAARSGERIWASAQAPPPRMGCRDLYLYALALAQAKLNPERIQTLLAVAAKMQDRDEKSRTFGNFHWYWSDPAVKDYNAVEFCMQAGVPLWLGHKDTLSEPARSVLKETMELAAQGCLRHRVNPSYTNIALMNAQNLLLLGQALGRAELADEGSRRLDRVCLDTYHNGLHEYDSPTYYGVDIDCLLLIEALADRPRAVEQARALLELIWTDIAANWYAPASRLGGARSRDYDYLRGLGMLDLNLHLAGWLDGPAPVSPGLVLPLLGRWKPPQDLHQLAARYPRSVRQAWGPQDAQSRTHFVLADVSLSASSAGYGTMDLPLCADIGTGRKIVRGYFIPDGRHDPYGRNKILEGTSGHMKSLHLRPFWAAAQNKADAIGVVNYDTLAPEVQTLESHFVLPRDVDAIWAGGKKIELVPPAEAAKAEQVIPLSREQAVVIRKGRAAVGVKVIFATDFSNRSLPAELVHDGNPHGAIRLTVRHTGYHPAVAAATRGLTAWGPRACFWVRVGGGLSSDDAFDRWRKEFESAAASVRPEANTYGTIFSVPAPGGPLSVTQRSPGQAPLVAPAPARAVLEIDGKDAGQEILARVEPVRTWRQRAEGAPAVIRVEAGGAGWEAEAGAILPGMEAGQDPAASGGQYVWAPGEVGQGGSANGGIVYRLDLAQAGTYHLWGRVLTPTPNDDSFRVQVRGGGGGAGPGGKTLLDATDWPTGVHKTWEWVRFVPGKSRPGLDLPAGQVRLEILAREDGAKIDRLFLTPDVKARPQ